MGDDFRTKIENYKTAQFDAQFPSHNQTKHCVQIYLDYHICQKSLTAKGKDPYPCEWYHHVSKSMCPSGRVEKWDEQREGN